MLNHDEIIALVKKHQTEAVTYIEKLQQRLGVNSFNSDLPPSLDTFKKKLK